MRLCELGIQTDYQTHSIIYNIDNKYNNLCQKCINNNTTPKLFYYYGRCCSKINLPNYNITSYNTICDRGHDFITSALEPTEILRRLFPQDNKQKHINNLEDENI